MPRIRLVRGTMLVLALVLAGLAASAAAAEARQIQGVVYGDHVDLTRLDWKVAPDAHDRCESSAGPDRPPDRSGERFCYANLLAIGVNFRFRLVDGRYTDAGPFEAVGYAFSPVVGDNLKFCEIRRLGGNHADPHAPYRCVTRWGPGTSVQDPRPRWFIEEKPTVTVTDRAQQADVIRKVCGADLRAGACRYLPSTLVPDLRKPAVQADAPFSNCTEGEAKHSFEVEEGFKTENSIEVGGEVGGKLFDVVKVAIEAKYEHKWEQERTKKSVYEMTVPPGHVGSYWYEAAYDEVSGDLQLYGTDVIYNLPNVRYDFPTASGDLGSVTARSSKIACGAQSTPPVCLPRDDVDGTRVCSRATPARVNPAWCLTDGFTDGSCPAPASVSDLAQAGPTDWAAEFVHWGAVGSGGVPPSATCPPGSTAVAGSDAGARRGGGRAQAWATCRTDGPAPADDSPTPSADPPAPSPRSGAPSPVTTPAATLSATAARTSSRDPRTVYVSLPLARRSDRHYHDMAAAVRLAFADRHGQAGGRALKLKVLSDADPRTGKWAAARALANARRAARDPRAVAFVGGANSGASAVAAPILNRAGLLQVSPSSTAVDLTTDRRLHPTGRRTFARVVPNDLNQANGLARYVQQTGATRVFVVHDGERYGRGLARLFRLAAAHHGLQVVAAARIPRGATSTAALAHRIARSAATAVLYAGLSENGAGPLLRDVAAADPAILIFGGDGLADHESFLRGARHDGYERRLYLTTPALDPDTLPAAGRALYRRLWARSGHRPDRYAVYAYEAMSATLGAIGRAHGRRAATLRAFFAIHDRRSPLGTYSITRSGDTTLGRYGQFTVHDARLDPPLCVGSGC